MTYLVKDYDTGEPICSIRFKKGESRFTIRESIREFNSYFTKGNEDGYYEGMPRNEWVVERLCERFKAKATWFNDGDLLYI